jgi:hypothetical protein
MIDTIVKQHPSDSLHDNVVPFIRRNTEDERPLAGGDRKLTEFLSTNQHLAEEVTNSSAGVVFNFMATMEFKHKSETAPQQEARRIRLHLLNDEKVVALNLHHESDVGLFRSATLSSHS